MSGKDEPDAAQLTPAMQAIIRGFINGLQSRMPGTALEPPSRAQAHSSVKEVCDESTQTNPFECFCIDPITVDASVQVDLVDLSTGVSMREWGPNLTSIRNDGPSPRPRSLECTPGPSTSSSSTFDQGGSSWSSRSDGPRPSQESTPGPSTSSTSTSDQWGPNFSSRWDGPRPRYQESTPGPSTSSTSTSDQWGSNFSSRSDGPRPRYQESTPGPSTSSTSTSDQWGSNFSSRSDGPRPRYQESSPGPSSSSTSPFDLWRGPNTSLPHCRSHAQSSFDHWRSNSSRGGSIQDSSIQGPISTGFMQPASSRQEPYAWERGARPATRSQREPVDDDEEDDDEDEPKRKRKVASGKKPNKRGRPRKAPTTGVKCGLCMKPCATHMTNPCYHFFCKPCMDDWLKDWTHCPKCMVSPFDLQESNFE